MNEITINSFIDYLSYVEKNYTRNHIFRGMNHLDYLLVPKIGREPYVARCQAESVVDDLQDMEEQIMNEFIKMSIPHMDLRNISSWDQWTIGQHHGLPTRFLDWTENPLIAAYFATENSNGNDVAVYVVDKTPLESEPCIIPAAPASDCISTTFTVSPNIFCFPSLLQISTCSAIGLDGVIG